MVVFKWKNNSCTDAALQVMQNAAKKVEDKILRDAVKGAHIPTLLNDELYPTSVAVAVSHNSGQGASLRGMECCQFEINGQVFNLAIIRK
jgi:hypothetical protein